MISLDDEITLREVAIDKTLSGSGFVLGDFPISRENALMLIRTAYSYGYQRPFEAPEQPEVYIGRALEAMGRARLPVDY